MNEIETMDYIMGKLIEEINGKCSFECLRNKGLLIIDGKDRSMGIKYKDSDTVEISVEYIGKSGEMKLIKTIDAPDVILKEFGLYNEQKKPWWKLW